MKIILTATLALTFLMSGCIITDFPTVGKVEVPIPTPAGKPPRGFLLLGRGEDPVPFTLIGYKNPPGGLPIGNRVQVVSNPDEFWVKIADESFPTGAK